MSESLSNGASKANAPILLLRYGEGERGEMEMWKIWCLLEDLKIEFIIWRTNRKHLKKARKKAKQWLKFHKERRK